MRTMANVVGDILNMSSEDLEMLAQGIVWFSSGTSKTPNKAEQFRFFLETHIREYDSMHKSISQYESMKELEKTEDL